MTLEKQKQRDWPGLALIVAGVLLAILGILSLLPAATVLLFFDAPSPDWNANYFFIGNVLAFPLVCLVSSLAIFLLRKRLRLLAFCAPLLPVLSLALIFAGGGWMNLASCGRLDCTVPTLQDQGNAVRVVSCPQPAPDGGDGLKTTGCGTLAVGVNATGSLDTTTEAHNWQFTAPGSHPITISIEHHGNSCTQIVILDAAGRVAERFEEDNKSNGCFSGMSSDMTTTSYYHFTPPGKGSYILRIRTPQAPSTYWLTIQ